METVFEAPNNPIPQREPKFLAYAVNENIQWKNLAVASYMVPDLPTKAAFFTEYAHTFAKRILLLAKVAYKIQPIFIALAYVVGGRRDNKLGSFVRNFLQQLETIS